LHDAGVDSLLPAEHVHREHLNSGDRNSHVKVEGSKPKSVLITYQDNIFFLGDNTPTT
jgi:hypothetical protein